ncbi:hypothetical protein K469DRAFT_690872 [Zopfia rhizophila CBS 207.26]|uniref:Amine oxidase domain-containing protein n=1 Tax=Zopfia rhizophila CBS 207.26 TaxID=1314779 RepID=A0A6A6DW46_9PEZI|nr:hypothetical protein K469DRAFT_690872 [Zopfia rhizophila CBS 207.26]
MPYIQYPYGLKINQLLFVGSVGQTAQDGRKRVAIIEAGISAASLAYQLHDTYGYLLPLEIVVFEASSQVGGLINSTGFDGEANAYSGFVEIGTSVFGADDLCLQAAIDDAGLRWKVVELPYPRTTAGVWGGDKFMLRRSRDLKSRTKTDYVRDVLKMDFRHRNTYASWGQAPTLSSIVFRLQLPKSRSHR